VSGYTPARTVYTLRFADEAYAGLVVQVRAATVGEMFDAEDSVAYARAMILSADDRLRWERAITLFLSCAQKWNVRDQDDAPIPLTRDGIATLEPSFMFVIFVAWLNAMAGNSPDPLEPGEPKPTEEGEEIPAGLAAAMQPG